MKIGKFIGLKFNEEEIINLFSRIELNSDGNISSEEWEAAISDISILIINRLILKITSSDISG